ncbi:DUF72 domain-containing protein [Methylocapsa polymorpha]|uniref:DUF72 domain-containing protein n=1 Tax=Methylocapsa polymorpha TaxID=3080828 RepID=A0ABZ0HS79_9HYPH|nr:DUF72 domain-containing protein [Methylocapsa sp. RX1]
MEGEIHIGTSGWRYDHWRGPFYPETLAAEDMLAFYAERFATVELNYSFYRLPEPESVRSWLARTPKHFLFACKASRYTTHVKRLKDAPKSFEKFFPRVDLLGEKLGPILFQTPPRFLPDPERLASFIAALPAKHRYAFEFRDRRWLCDAARDVLAEANCAFCIFDIEGVQSPSWTTADFVYLRLHGPGGKYQGSYDDRALRSWAKQIYSFARQEIDVYCYFNNDQAGHAPANALRLIEMIKG